MVILTKPMGTKLIEVEICILKFRFHFLIWAWHGIFIFKFYLELEVSQGLDEQNPKIFVWCLIWTKLKFKTNVIIIICKVKLRCLQLQKFTEIEVLGVIHEQTFFWLSLSISTQRLAHKESKRVLHNITRDWIEQTLFKKN